MNKITTAEVKMAQMAVSNLSDDVRAFDISAIVTYNTMTNTFGMSQNGQVSSGTVNEDGKTIATFSQTNNTYTLTVTLPGRVSDSGGNFNNAYFFYANNSVGHNYDSYIPIK